MSRLVKVFSVAGILAAPSCVSVLPSDRAEPASVLAPSCPLNSDRFSWPAGHPPKLVWLSIDSLNEEGLRKTVRLLKAPHPFGFKKILENTNKQSHLTVHEPTITASSHISTITCSAAGRHGTFANSQWNGSRMVSGFVRPYQTETFATSIKKSGLKVVTAGYPTLDNLEPTRSVSEGFAYGTSIGRSAVVKAPPGEEFRHDWFLQDQNKSLEVRFRQGQSWQRQNIICEPQPCLVTDSGVENILDVTFLHQKEHLRAYIQILNEHQLYFSQLKKSNVFPAQVQQLHDQCGLIFSPGKNPSLAEYGVGSSIAGMKHNLRYFSLNWAHYIPSTNADAVFLYLEDLDALRHQLADRIALEQDAVAHLADVDRLLGEFIESLPNETNVVIVGDHGMSTVKTELNVRQILPTQAVKQSQIITSGGSLFLYGRDSQSINLSQTPTPVEQQWLLEAKSTLTNFKTTPNGDAVFTKVLIKGSKEMQQAGLNHPEAPYLIAFAHPHFALKDSLSPDIVLSDASWTVEQRPIPPGQHGHASNHELMHTYVTGWGPDLNALHFSKLKSNLDLVPTVGEALNLPVPQHCQK